MRAYNRRKTCREHRNFFTKQHSLGFSTTTIYGVKFPEFYTTNKIRILCHNNIVVMFGRNNIYSIFKPIISKMMKRSEDNII